MDYIALLKLCGGATIFYAIIFFVAIRIQNTVNYKKRALLCLILGLSLTIVSTFVLWLDIETHVNSIQYLTVLLPYVAFPLMGLIFTIATSVAFLLLSKNKKIRLRNEHQYYSQKMTKETAPVQRSENEYIYIALKYEDKFLLKKIVNSAGVEEYGGLAVKVPSQFTSSEFVDNVVKSLDLDYEKYTLSGTAKRHMAGDICKYFVYTIELNSITSKIEDLEGVSPVVLYGFNLSDFNKQILFHLVLKEPFDIEI